MSHYDECRDKYDDMTSNEKMDLLSADQSRNKYMSYKEALKELLLKRHLDKHSKLLDERYNHTEDYWNKKKCEVIELIESLDKDTKGE